MGAAQKSTHLRVRRLPPADLGDGRDDLHASKLPLTVWFWAAYLMATHSNGISALQLQKQLGIGSYRSAWLLAHKLRATMVDPERNPLSGLVEIDEASLPFRTKDDPPTGGQGRSHDGKMLIVGAIELGDGNIPGRLRLAEISSYGAADLGHFVETAADPDAIAKTDGWSGYAAVPADRPMSMSSGRPPLPRPAVDPPSLLQQRSEASTKICRPSRRRRKTRQVEPLTLYRTGAMCISGKTDFVEAHPERVAERISDHQDKENQYRQREQQRELKVRQLGGALPSPHFSPWSWSARPCPADRKSRRRTTPSSRPPARQHYSPYFLFRSTICSLIASIVSTISPSSCRYSCSVSLSQLLNSSAQTTLQMPLG